MTKFDELNNIYKATLSLITKHGTEIINNCVFLNNLREETYVLIEKDAFGNKLRKYTYSFGFYSDNNTIEGIDVFSALEVEDWDRIENKFLNSYTVYFNDIGSYWYLQHRYLYGVFSSSLLNLFECMLQIQNELNDIKEQNK